MKTLSKISSVYVLVILSLFIFITGCDKDGYNLKNIDDVKLKVSFESNTNKQVSNLKSKGVMSVETPENYYVALKSVVLKGEEGTADVTLFSASSLSSSLVFDFSDANTTHSLLDGIDIPDGNYASVEMEIYYLQMNIAISTQDRGIERRNFRIYMSDDAEIEAGLHQPGDMTQINDDVEIGWLLGENQTPNMDPVTPRTAAYTYNGDGINWYDFAGKSGEIYGPFGSLDFMTTATLPVYKTSISFEFIDNNGTDLIIDFNIADCWQYEDKDEDGAFGAGDLDAVNPTAWHMAMPIMTVTLQ